MPVLKYSLCKVLGCRLSFWCPSDCEYSFFFISSETGPSFGVLVCIPVVNALLCHNMILRLGSSSQCSEECHLTSFIALASKIMPNLHFDYTVELWITAKSGKIFFFLYGIFLFLWHRCKTFWLSTCISIKFWLVHQKWWFLKS